jgi:hypothetical protein
MDTEIELRTKTKEELILFIRGQRASIGHLKTALIGKDALIKHLILRIKRIGTQIDYLSKYPFSDDRGYRTRPSGRDRRH